MNYGYLIENSFHYTADGLTSQPVKWLLLIIMSMLQIIPVIGFVIFLIISNVRADTVMSKIPLLVGGLIGTIILMWIFNAFYQGFMVRVLHGDSTLPDFPDPLVLFIDGVKFTIIQLLYFMVPLIILLGSFFIAFTSSAYGGSMAETSAMMTMISTILAGMILSLLFFIIFGVFWVIGIVRFARTGSIGQAFYFRDILGTIGQIGWLPYIASLVILVIIIIAYSLAMSILQTILSILPIIGVIFILLLYLVQLILTPFVAIFVFRYFSLIYDSSATV
ncbi:DUF4013 domain-containing protein [bacterium]|nr:MAG: DUF4013 domain-containing protein [bacterium]